VRNVTGHRSRAHDADLVGAEAGVAEDTEGRVDVHEDAVVGDASKSARSWLKSRLS